MGDCGFFNHDLKMRSILVWSDDVLMFFCGSEGLQHLAFLFCHGVLVNVT